MNMKFVFHFNHCELSSFLGLFYQSAYCDSIDENCTEERTSRILWSLMQTEIQINLNDFFINFKQFKNMSSANKNQSTAHAQAQDKGHASAQTAQQAQAQRGGQHQAAQNSQQQVYHLDPDMIGAIKIKDGLFIGDELASQDIEFVIANKVTHIINCAGKQIMNHWEPIGVAYLAFYWLDQDNQVVLDAKDEASNAIFDFIEEAVEQTESVLVHSVRGQSRATCTLAAYIMRKYRWSLLKSLEFLNSRRPDLEIRATFIHQLSAYEQRLQKKFKEEKFTSVWEDLSEQQPYITSEELILRNTFINARMGPLADFNRGVKNAQPKKRNLIKWIDEVEKDRAGKKEGLKINDFKDDLLRKKKVEKVEVHRQKSTGAIRGTLRDRKFSLAFITGVEQMDRHALFAGSQTLRVGAKETKGAAKPPERRKKARDQEKMAENQKRSSSMAVGETASSRQASTRVAPEQLEAKKQGSSKNKNQATKSGQTMLKADARPSATPDMFYKKGEAVEHEAEDEADEDAGDGVGVIVEGEKKAATGATGNVVVINDEEEDDQILSGIEVDDDEGDSCSDETSQVILKNAGKDHQAASDMRQRASSGSKNLRNSRSERTRSRGGSGGSRGSRTGQRISKPNQKEAVPQAPNNQNPANAKEFPNDSLIAFTEENESTEANKQKEKASTSHLWSKDEEQVGPTAGQEEKGLVQRSNNFVQEPVQQNNGSNQGNKTEGGAASQAQRGDQQSAPMQQQQQQQPQNITNIINNNNINNFIINDPKTVARLQAGLLPTNANVNGTNIATTPSQSTAVNQPTSHPPAAPNAASRPAQQQARRATTAPSQTNIAPGSAATGSTATTAAQQLQQPTQFQRSQMQQLYQQQQQNGASTEGNRVIGTFGARHGSNVRGVQNAAERGHQPVTNPGSENMMVYQNQVAGMAAQQLVEGQQEQRQQVVNHSQLPGKHHSKTVKVRQGTNGVIILNQQGINFTQQQAAAHQQSRNGVVVRDAGKHHRGASEHQMADQSQAALNVTGSRAHHKRSSSHQNSRGTGMTFSKQRQGGRSDAEHGQPGGMTDGNFHTAQGGGQVQAEVFAMPTGTGYINQGHSQLHYKRGSYQSGTTGSGAQAGQPKMVASLVQKEMAKRHESPRSRRQIVGQFGPGGQQQASGQVNAAAVGGKKYSHQAPVNYQGGDQLDLTGVAGIGSVGMGVNMQDINKFFINEQRTNSQGNYGNNGQHSKIGNYQYRQNQNQQQIKFGRGASASAQQAKTPSNAGNQARKGIEFGVEVTGMQSLPGSSMGTSQGNQPQQQAILNRTGPIKIQNRLQDGTATDDGKNSLNNTLNLGRDGGKSKTLMSTVNKFNESLNISEVQTSIQEAAQPNMQKVMTANGVRFGNPNGQVTKVKRQLNIINSGQGQGAILHGGTGHKQNLAWVAHRHSSVKSRAQQKQAHSAGGTGSESNIFHQKDQNTHGNMRPGTAPKQAMLNNFAGTTHISTVSHSNHHAGNNSRKASGQDRPLSPYTKVFQQPNSVNVGGGGYKRRAHSKREASQQQVQNLISPQNNLQKQRPGSTTFQIQFQPQASSSAAFNQRRSQSPAANAAARMGHQQTMTLNQFQKQQLLNSGHVGSVATQQQHSAQVSAAHQQQYMNAGASAPTHQHFSGTGGQTTNSGVSPYQRLQGVKRRR